MKHILIIIAAVLLVGCGDTEPKEKISGLEELPKNIYIKPQQIEQSKVINNFEPLIETTKQVNNKTNNLNNQRPANVANFYQKNKSVSNLSTEYKTNKTKTIPLEPRRAYQFYWDNLEELWEMREFAVSWRKQYPKEFSGKYENKPANTTHIRDIYMQLLERYIILHKNIKLRTDDERSRLALLYSTLSISAHAFTLVLDHKRKFELTKINLNKYLRGVGYQKFYLDKDSGYKYAYLNKAKMFKLKHPNASFTWEDTLPIFESECGRWLSVASVGKLGAILGASSSSREAEFYKAIEHMREKYPEQNEL